MLTGQSRQRGARRCSHNFRLERFHVTPQKTTERVHKDVGVQNDVGAMSHDGGCCRLKSAQSDVTNPVGNIESILSDKWVYDVIN